MSKNIVKLFVEVYSCEGTRSACACWMLAKKDSIEKKCAPRTEDVSEEKMANGMAITLLKSIPTSCLVEVYSTSEIILSAFQREAADLGHELVATKTTTKENRWSKLCKTEAVYNAQLIQMGFWKGKKPLIPEFPKDPEPEEEEPETPKAKKTFTAEEVAAMVAAQVAEKMAELEKKLAETTKAKKAPAKKVKAETAKAETPEVKEAPEAKEKSKAKKASAKKAAEELPSGRKDISRDVLEGYYEDALFEELPTIPGLEGEMPF